MQVEIFQYQLSNVDLDLKQAHRFLDEDEQRRADRIIVEPARKSFILSHALLRETLAVYLDIKPKNIHYAYNRFGKPALPNNPMHFNLSHSGDRVLIGLCESAAVGVDIEFHKDIPDYEELAARFFSRAEQAAISALPDEERLNGFYRVWTRKEAYLKMLGRGVSFGLSKFCVDIKPDGMDNLISTDEDESHIKKCYLGSINAQFGYSAALCVPNLSTLSINYHDF